MKNEPLDHNSKKNTSCLSNFVMDKISPKKERMKKKKLYFDYIEILLLVITLHNIGNSNEPTVSVVRPSSEDFLSHLI